MSAVLAGLGTALPSFRVSQADYTRFAHEICRPDDEDARLLDVLFRRSGVEWRSSVVLKRGDGPVLARQSFYDPAGDRDDRGPSTGRRMEQYRIAAPELVARASRAALSAAHLSPRDITHIVTVSCTGFIAPGPETLVAQDLGLRPTVARTHVGFMGCHGALNGLRVARAFVDADPQARVLLAAVELCTLHFQYGADREKIVANTLFADGAAAAVCVPDSVLPDESALRVSASGSCILLDSGGEMTWRIGDHGFEMTLSMRVPELICRHLRPWLEEWLSGQGLAVSGVGSWVVHPGGPKILDAFREAMSLPESAVALSREVLAECGNMSSPTVLFILERLLRTAGRRPIVILGFGPGLAIEAALLV